MTVVNRRGPFVKYGGFLLITLSVETTSLASAYLKDYLAAFVLPSSQLLKPLPSIILCTVHFVCSMLLRAMFSKFLCFAKGAKGAL